jgi:hypothetical protein
MIKLATYILAGCAAAGTVTYVVIVQQKVEEKAPAVKWNNYIEQNTKGLKKW